MSLQLPFEGIRAMPFGPGKYDDIMQYVLEKSGATQVCVLIIDGEKGPSFSHKVRASDLLEQAQKEVQMARALRLVATQMWTDANERVAMLEDHAERSKGENGES